MILETAKKFHVKPEHMPRTLFIFSDMQFNEAIPDDYQSLHQRHKKMFFEAGYELPAIIYWNLVAVFLFSLCAN
jgi:hypothetical protein